MTTVSEEWRQLLARSGYQPGEVLGSGMEGTVLDLGADLVAKVWHRRSAEELAALRVFYDAVTAAAARVDTRGRGVDRPAFPVIESVLHLGVEVATIERRLRGQPLRSDGGSTAGPVTEAQVGCLTEVLASLRALPVDPAMAVLPVLPGEPAFDPAQPFGDSLAVLVESRVATYHGTLAARVPELDLVTGQVVRRLRALDTVAPVLLHGDLIPTNVLVDAGADPADRLHPRAVLDFGFLTTVGDQAFDAAVTASIADMYGPHARETERRLDAAFGLRFDLEPRRVGTYRAAYALVTSNCFSVSGRDGHFEWCAAMLQRPDVCAALAD